MTDQFHVEPCPLCDAKMERMGGQTVWEHPGDDCPLAMVQIPLAALEGWNARSVPPIPELKAGAEPYLITPHIERCVSAFLHGYSTVDGHRLSGVALALAAERDTAQAEVERLNEWADTFSDAQQKERGLAEARIKELEREIERTKGVSEWLLLFDDVEVQSERFSGPGAQEAAIARYDLCRNSYNCTLYRGFKRG